MDFLNKTRSISIAFLLIVAFQAKAITKVDASEIEKLQVLQSDSNPLSEVRLYYLWASWCPDCRQKLRGAIPDLQKQKPEVSVLTVNMDAKAEHAKGFIADENLQLPVYRDEEKLFAKKLHLFAVPSWVVVKRQEDGWEVIDKQTGSNIDGIMKALAIANGGQQ